MRSLPAIVLGSVLVAGLAAQPAPHPTTNPKVFTGVFAGSATTTYPLGRTGGLIQYWRRGADFTAPQPLLATGARPAQNQTAAAATLNVELVMSNTAVTFTTFSATYANNFGAQRTTAFVRKPVNLPAINAANDPDQPVAWLLHDVPFLFLGPHLIVQFDLGTAVSSVGINRPADAMPTTVVAHVGGARSCGGTLVASGTGTAFNLALSGAPANAPASLLLGVENVRLGGAPVLPLRLDMLGMVGCHLGLDPLLAVGFTTDGSGGTTWNFPVNYTAANDSDVVHTQVLHLRTNPGGWATTNATHSVLGSAGLGNYAYNYTLDGPTAEFGPYPTHRGAVLLFRP